MDDSEVSDVGASEDDVFVLVIAGRDFLAVFPPALSAIRADVGKRNSMFFGVDAVQRAFVPDFALAY